MRHLQENIGRLQSCGFSKTKSTQALKDAGNNFDVALRILKKQQEQKKQRQRLQSNVARPPDEKPAPDDSEMEMAIAPPKEKKHPCIVQYKKCRYGEFCLLRDLPGDVCINHFMGNCAFADSCKRRHHVDGVDIRAARRPEVREERITLQTGVIIKLDKVNGHHLLIGRPVERDAEPSADVTGLVGEPPPPSRFNLIQGSEPTHTDPYPLGWQMQSTSCASVVEAPRPFLEAVRRQPSEQNTTSSTLVQGPNGPSSALSSASKAAATAVSPSHKGKHPCIFQFGSCKYGKNCNHADRDEDVCVLFLNGLCNRGSTCPYRHENNAEFLRRAKPQVFGKVLSDEIALGDTNMKPEEMQKKYGETLQIRQQHQQRKQEEGEQESWMQTPWERQQAVHLSSFLPDLGLDVDCCSGDGQPTPQDNDDGRLDDMELNALVALIEAFPATEPRLLLHALRSANGDVDLVADTLSKLDGFETVEDVVAYLWKERTEEEASLEQKKTQSADESLLTLCSLFPALDVPSIAAVLGKCNGDYAEAYGILLCSTENITQQAFGNCWNGSLKQSDEFRLQKVCKMFPAVPKEVVRSTFGAAGGDAEETISALNEMTKEMLNLETETVPAFALAAASKKTTSEEPPSYFLRPSATRDEIQKFYEEVDDELRKLGDWRRVREQAYIINSCRIRVMSQATQAYKRGDGKTAKTLSRHGKQLGAEYVHLNRIAMIALERERLARDPASTLDLHGFHVDEAVEVLRRRVQLCVQKGIRRLTIVIGSGRHSRCGHSTIYPVVLRQLKEDPELERFVKLKSVKPAYIEVDIVLRDR
ncbi:hypothetical protein TcG_07824 [Trypanosoma cruzi]|nr:hypothetical protein BCY84_12028 [Trypanosoma cruzi cruzi]PWU88698.1 hypothetical protein C4B63_69g28 [Trypanosoma cruzi]RNF14313.1 hypothetical protein TcG_07824 [Trypanosoma cruzi]